MLGDASEGNDRASLFEIKIACHARGHSKGLQPGISLLP